MPENESDKETGSQLKWERCPAELLCLIFRTLDTESLVRCMYVCRTWNSAALYTVEKKNLWEKIANKFIVDSGQMVKMKSLNMSWKDLFKNSVMWSHCDKAELLVHNTYEISTVHHVHVYKDNLIIVSSNGVKYFDLIKSEFKRYIEMECIDFLENDNIILQVTPSTEDCNCKTLHLYGKRNVEDFNILKNNEKIVDKVIQYRLDKEGCYVFDNRAQLVLYKPKDVNWNVQFLARYYGNYKECCYLHIYEDKPYILLKWCNIYCANKQVGFERVLNILAAECPADCTYVKMFHHFGVLYGVEASKEFRFIRKYIDGHKVFIMQCPDMTCATEHGEMLFLGYSDGKIEFFMPREMNEKAALKRQYSITEVSNTYDNCIISIDIYDEREREQHHVFVATKSQVYHLLLTHTNINDYLWSVFPERMSLSSDFVP